MLRALFQKLLSTAKQQTGDPNVGQLTVISVDREHPSYGEVDGEPVTILGEGNMIGFSPVTLLRDTAGEEEWIPKARLRNTDPRLTPINFGQAPQTTAGHSAR